jgi:hypothetical protein
MSSRQDWATQQHPAQNETKEKTKQLTLGQPLKAQNPIRYKGAPLTDCQESMQNQAQLWDTPDLTLLLNSVTLFPTRKNLSYLNSE